MTGKRAHIRRALAGAAASLALLAAAAGPAAPPPADPIPRAQERAQSDRAADFEAQRLRLQQARPSLALRDSDPAGYVRAMRAWIEQSLALADTAADLPAAQSLRAEVASDFALLGAHARFRARQPTEAIALLERAAQLRSAEAFPVDALAIADIQRFDLRDASAAAATYRSALARLEALNAAAGARPQDREQAESNRLVRRWIGHELAYLEQGRAFSGTLRRDDLSLPIAELWLSIVALPAANGSLDASMPSQYNLGGVVQKLASDPPDDVRALLVRHDPAGYLSAVLLGILDVRASAADPAMAAGARAVREAHFRQRRIVADYAGDARFASPEATWAHFIASARNGDPQAMVSCLTARLRPQFEPLFTRMSRDELAEMSDSFVGFHPGETLGGIRQAVLVRRQDGGKLAAFATFVDEAGEWKIDSM